MSLVIPKEDYELFQDENYYIDDGIIHYFNVDHNSLIVLNAENAVDIEISFSEVMIEGKKRYEISSVQKALNKDISPQTDLKQARNDVLKILEEAFVLLDEVLKKRAKPNNSVTFLKFKYHILNKVISSHDTVICVDNRFSYLQFIPQLDYWFTVLDN